jgi:hypothetical protein
MMDTARVGAEKQVIGPGFIVQSLRFQRPHNMRFTAVAELFLFAIFLTMGTMD